MLLCSWSYHYTLPQKNKKCLFSIPCLHVDIEFTSNRLRMYLFCVWCVGCATANRRSRLTSWPVVTFGSIPAFNASLHCLSQLAFVFNQLTNCNVQFNSRFIASLYGETTSVFNHFKSPWWSEKLKASSWVMNLVKKMHTKISGEEYYTEKFLCVVRSAFSGKSIVQKSFCALYDQHRAWSMWSAAPASSVLGTFLLPMAECMMSTQRVTSTKENQ